MTTEGKQMNNETGRWILGDEKDGMPAVIRWPVTNGHRFRGEYLRFNLFTSEEAVLLRDFLNALEDENRRLREVLAGVLNTENSPYRLSDDSYTIFRTEARGLLAKGKETGSE